MPGGLPPGGPPAAPEEPAALLVIVPVPALVAVLLALRQEKGEDLTQAEVLACRDNAVCMTTQPSVARAIADKRGYDDIDPEHVWDEWQAFIAEYDDAAQAPA